MKLHKKKEKERIRKAQESEHLIQVFDIIESAIRYNAFRNASKSFGEASHSTIAGRTVTKEDVEQILTVWPEAYRIRQTIFSGMPDFIIALPMET